MVKYGSKYIRFSILNFDIHEKWDGLIVQHFHGTWCDICNFCIVLKQKCLLIIWHTLSLMVVMVAVMERHHKCRFILNIFAGTMLVSLQGYKAAI